MEAYSTEEQQVEAIKDFLRSYGSYIIGGILLGLAIVAGYHFYMDHQQQVNEQLSTQYSAALQDDSLVNFAKTNQGTVYSDLAALQLAKQNVDNGKLDEAENLLNMVVSSDKKEAGLHLLARLRLARVQVARGEVDAALTTLNYQWPEILKANAEAVKGDALAMKKDVDGAREAYQQALLGADPNQSSVLRMKLDNLPVAAQE